MRHYAVLFSVLLSSPSFGEGLNYFGDQEIDFFKEKTSNPEPLKIDQENKPIEKPKSTFDWNKYLDPKNDEFFKEGDYTPPAPFMEIARNPTDENIKNWFLYLETKNAISNRLSQKLAGFPAHQAQSFNPVQEALPLFADAKSTRIRMYFDSKCPHCHRMFKELERLRNQGFWIETRQVDQDLSFRKTISFPVTGATSKELSEYKISSVPTLLIADLKSGTVQNLQGFQTAETIIKTIQNKTGGIVK